MFHFAPCPEDKLNSIAKQWLKRGLRLRDRIRSLKESLDAAYDIATGTTVSNADETVARSGVTRKPEQYSILAEKVEAEKRRLDGILAEITAVIAQVEDNSRTPPRRTEAGDYSPASVAVCDSI